MRSLKYYAAHWLWKAHVAAVVILVAGGSLSVSRWAFQEMRWQRYTINETCLDNSNAEHPAEQCPFDDRTKELGLVVFLLTAVPAVVRFTKWKDKEKELTASFDNMRA
jgi:hypothetical protein